jgi:hypothetical protein
VSSIPPVATQPDLVCNLHWATRTSARVDRFHSPLRLLGERSEKHKPSRRHRRDSFCWPEEPGPTVRRARQGTETLASSDRGYIRGDFGNLSSNMFVISAIASKYERMRVLTCRLEAGRP